MNSLRNLPLQPRRDAWLEINLDALEYNARLIRSTIPKPVELMAIVKADAYGHGAGMVLPTLEASGIRMAGVASMDEAIHIRQAGLKIPVLVIGVIPDWAMSQAVEHDIALTIFDAHHLESLKKAATSVKKPFKVHIKVDTGMHRIGIPWEEAADFIRHCQGLDFLEVAGIFTHLADSHDPALTQLQLARWETVCQSLEALPRWVHVANSGAALNPALAVASRFNNLARLGIAFFGYGEPPGCHLNLKPVMGLKARIMHIQTVPPETGISYGHLYKTPAGQDSRIATIPVGYADGVPRGLSNQLSAFCHGVKVPQVGAITMDQMMFDITAVPQAAIGDTLTLLGREGSETIGLDDWAGKLNTIEYELMCALRVRLPKTYTR